MWHLIEDGIGKGPATVLAVLAGLSLVAWRLSRVWR